MAQQPPVKKAKGYSSTTIPVDLQHTSPYKFTKTVTSLKGPVAPTKRKKLPPPHPGMTSGGGPRRY